MRKRTTWNTDEIIKRAAGSTTAATNPTAAMQRQADPYAMNQDHLKQQPPADKYLTGDPSAFAEDIHPNDWDVEYSGGAVKRNEIGQPEMRADTFNHPEKTASQNEALLIKKGDLAVKAARFMGKGKRFATREAAEQWVEDQAVALMNLPDQDLINTFTRLANEEGFPGGEFPTAGQQQQQAGEQQQQAGQQQQQAQQDQQAAAYQQAQQEAEAAAYQQAQQEMQEMAVQAAMLQKQGNVAAANIIVKAMQGPATRLAALKSKVRKADDQQGQQGQGMQQQAGQQQQQAQQDQQAGQQQQAAWYDTSGQQQQAGQQQQQAGQQQQAQGQQGQGMQQQAQGQQGQGMQQQAQGQQQQAQGQQGQPMQQQAQGQQQQAQGQQDVQQQAQSMIQQALQQAMGQGQQAPMQQQAQGQQGQPMQQQAGTMHHQAHDDALLDQMLMDPSAQPGGGMISDMGIELEPSPMDVGEVNLGPEDAVLRNLFANDETQAAEQAQAAQQGQGGQEQGQQHQASVRTASTRTVGTRPTTGVSRIGGGGAPPAKNEEVNRLASLWSSAPDVRDAFGLK